MTNGSFGDGDPIIAVVGAGSWGTAFANALAHKGLKVMLWARRQQLAEEILTKHLNPDYLPGIYLSPRLRATSEIEAAVERAHVVVMAIPTKAFRDVLQSAAKHIRPRAPIVSLAKGLELESLKRMSQVMAEEIEASGPSGPRGPERIAVLSGPNLAKEIAMGQPAASVIACEDLSTADMLQELFMTPIFRTYSDHDIVGVEIGGILKNVIAIAAGIADGVGFGANTKATVITRGLAEMKRLGVRLGADPLTFSGLAGVGDLICTCMSPLSRNNQVGSALGQGRKIDEILAGMRQVAEGVNASKAVKE
ncbi:MAG: NAD(P)H-dependent glycerol-3-phosphate dehydrogenase, partial [Acidimicrobiia bacterium]